VEYQRKEELFKRREENLRKKDLELQAALVLFNKFLKENEHKRRRAEHRANEEVKKTIKWVYINPFLVSHPMLLLDSLLISVCLHFNRRKR
jgi:signal recognition particle GTPase